MGITLKNKKVEPYSNTELLHESELDRDRLIAFLNENFEKNKDSIDNIKDKIDKK